MAATSYNGYTVIQNYGDPRLAPLHANGKPFLPVPGVLAGPVAVVMNYLADFLDREVEPLDLMGYEKDDWCFTPKQVTGGSGWSCHASATAFDYNSQKHPQGVRGTWTPEQIRKVDAFLKNELNGVVRWGEHYTGTTNAGKPLVDGMHFEIYASLLAVSVVAQRIQNKPTPIPPAPAPTPEPTPPPKPVPPVPEDDVLEDIMAALKYRWIVFDYKGTTYVHDPINMTYYALKDPAERKAVIKVWDESGQSSHDIKTVETLRPFGKKIT